MDPPTPRTTAAVFRMTPEDVAEVARIERQSSSTPWSEESLRYEIGQPTSRYVIAKMDGEVVGHLGMWLIAHEAHITTFSVDTRHRRMGIGGLLLWESMTQAINEGVSRFTLEVRASNVPAQNLYRKFGFVPVAVRKRYYAPEQEDAVVMWIDQANTAAYRSRLAAMAPCGRVEGKSLSSTQ